MIERVPVGRPHVSHGSRVIAMARTIATTTPVDLEGLLEFVRPRHRMLLITSRADGSPQASPVTGGVDDSGRLVISSYPERAKTRNARRRPEVSVVVVSEDWDGPWVQITGTCEVLDATAGEEALDAFVEYFRNIAGEHSDWAEYRQAMLDQGKSLLRITPTTWGPVATGGFPPDKA
jgi:PPOX class probable F420-dependent enzyme